MRMKGKQTILGVCWTQCMLYSVYAVLGVCCTRYMVYSVYAVRSVWCALCQRMIRAWRGGEGWFNFVFCNDVRVMDKKERDEDEDENDVEDTSGYETSGVPLAWLAWKDLLSDLLHSGSELVPAISGMVIWLAPEILLCPSFSSCFVPSAVISLFLVLNFTIT